MRIESDEGFVSLIANNSAEAKLLEKVARATNSKNSSHPASLADKPKDGIFRKIKNGVLRLVVS